MSVQVSNDNDRQLIIVGLNLYQRGEQYSTPVGDIMKYVERFGLNDVIQRCVINGNWKLRLPLLK